MNSIKKKIKILSFTNHRDIFCILYLYFGLLLKIYLKSKKKWLNI